MRIVRGNYIGDGSSDRAIITGSQPEWLMIWNPEGFFNCIKSTAHAGALSTYGNGTDVSNAIKSFDANGFTIGDHVSVNNNLKEYSYFYIIADATDNFAVGTYTGDGNDNRNISFSPAFTPDFVWVINAATLNTSFRFTPMTGDQSKYEDSGLRTNGIQSVGSGTFQVGTDTSVNNNATKYYYIALKDESGKLKANTYAGNGADDRNLTGIGFDPNLFWTQASAAGSTHRPILRGAGMVGDISYEMTNIGFVTNAIQDFITDGVELGTSTYANENAVDYYYVAMLAEEAISITTDERDSEILGAEAIDSERDSEITGAGTVDERDSEIRGTEEVANERDSEITGQEFLSIPRTYRIIVKDKDDNILGEFHQFRNLNFGKRLNNYGTASFEIPVNDPKAASLVSLREYTVWIYYQEDATTTLVWSGEQALREGKLDNAGNNWCTIHCYDWFEQLRARYTFSERIFTQIDAGEIAWTLIDEAQHEYPLEVATVQPANSSFYSMSPFSDEEWENLTNVLTQNNTSMSIDMASGTSSIISIPMQAAGIPEDATIVGIEVLIDHWQDIGLGSPDAKDVLVKIVRDDAVVGENRALDSLIPDDETNDYAVYGGPNDLWGLEWTPDDVNVEGGDTGGDNNGFRIGLAYSLQGEIVNVDHVKINVYYRQLQENENYDFGITEGTIEETIDRDRSYYNQNVMEAIINLTNVLSGFDFEITNDRVFNVYSLKGEDLTDDVILEYGVNIESAQVVEDFTDPVNKAIVIGQSTDDVNNLVRIERNHTESQNTYRVREGLISEMDVTDTNTMEDKGDALNRKYGTPLFKIDIDLVKSTGITVVDFSLGDLIRLIIRSGIYDIHESYRIFEWSIVFDSNNAEKLSLILGRFTLEPGVS